MIDMDLWGGRSSSELGQGAHSYVVAVGVVTNNNDMDDLGRVKVKFPWLSETGESYWARIATPMAGDKRGLYWLPEVDDEVLVVFEHGLIDRPFIIGGLWQGKHKPPVKSDGGKNNLRLLKSRSGHTITLDDTKDKEKITIADHTEKNTVVVDSEKNTITITSEKDIVIQAKGKITIETSDGDLEIKAKSIKIEAQQSFSIKAQQSGTIEASSSLAIKGSAGVKVNDGALEVV